MLPIVLNDLFAGDEVAPAQADLFARRKPVILLGRIFAEIVLLDVEHARERNFAGSGRCVFRIVDRVELFGLAFGIVLDHDPRGRARPSREEPAC